MLPHLDAAFDLALRLMGERRDAEDAVQEAYLRAFRFFEGYRGGDSRVWILTIVRNACYDSLKRNRMKERQTTEFEEEIHSENGGSSNAEAEILERIDGNDLKRALDSLAVEDREILILREMEGFSYKEIAGSISIPIGTVMSRLARARQKLKNELLRRRDQ